MPLSRLSTSYEVTTLRACIQKAARAGVEVVTTSHDGSRYFSFTDANGFAHHSGSLIDLESQLDGIL